MITHSSNGGTIIQLDIFQIRIDEFIPLQFSQTIYVVH